MNIKTLWTIILRIFGLYIALQVIPSFFQFIITLFAMAQMAGPGMFAFLLMPFLSFTVYLLLFLSLIFKSEWLINKLKLDKGFNEETIDLRYAFDKATKIVILCLGGWLVIDAIPTFIQAIFYSAPNGTAPNAPASGILLPIIKIAMGILLIACYPAISKFIVKKDS